MFSHNCQLLERPVGFAILLIYALLQMCTGLNGQWLSATELKLWRIVMLQQSEATLEGNSPLNCLNSTPRVIISLGTLLRSPLTSK